MAESLTSGLAIPTIDWGVFWFWFWVVLILIVLGGVVVLLFHFKRFKHRIIIFEKRANNIVRVIFDQAREIKVNNTILLKLFWTKYKIPRLESQKYTFVKGKKDIYFYFKIDDDHLLPITLLEDPVKFKGVAQDLKFWLFEQWRKTESIYGEDNFWKKNAGALVAVGGIAVVLVLIMILFGQFTDINAGLMKVAEALGNIKIEPIIMK